METRTCYAEAYFPPKSLKVRCGMQKEFALSCLSLSLSLFVQADKRFIEPNTHFFH